MPAPLVLPAPSPPAPTTTQGSTFKFRQIRGNLVSVGLCIFGIWLLVQMEANVHSKNAAQRHSPLQAPPVVLAAPVATPGTQILPSFAVMLKPKSRFRSRFLEFTLNSSGLSIILPLLHETQTSIVQTTFREEL